MIFQEFTKTVKIHQASRKVDIYTLGVTLDIILTGYYPYSLDVPVGMREIHLSKDLSPECRNLISRMLVTKPKKRISLKKIRIHPWLLVPGEESVNLRKDYKTSLTKKARNGLCWSLQRYYY